MSKCPDVLTLAQQLIERPSITPEDAGCQDLLCQYLANAGFIIETLPAEGVRNIWARHGQEGPLMVLAGHTDVVPPGPERLWRSPPFSAEVRDAHLYGRGAADMKGSVAAMTCAAIEFVRAQPNHRGRLALLITSDEEGPAVWGTRHVIDVLQQRGERIDWCLVGEPSCHSTFGDTIKHGRRGSLNAEITLRGKQGHVAYPHLVHNPIPLLAELIRTLDQEVWDRGHAHFPPTSLQFSTIEAGTGAYNVVPAEARARFNFRYSAAVTAEQLQARVQQLLELMLFNEEMRSQFAFEHQLDWNLSGLPFITEPGDLTAALSAAIHEHTGITPELSTSGGTSDGRFIAPTGAQVVEFGPLNATIHQVDECVEVASLYGMQRIVVSLLQRLLAD